VNQTRLILLSAFALLFAVVFAGDVRAQRAGAQRPRTNASNVLNTLPPSDAVVFVDVRRLLNEAIPGVFANEPAKLAQVNTQIDNFKTKTGIDPRSFDRFAVGLRYTYPAAGVTKVENVAIARGTFKVDSVVAAGRLAAKGTFQEQKYKGTTIYVFSLNEQVRLFGLFSLRVSDLAVSFFDANTVAIGSPLSVRGAIDAGKSGKRVSSELIALAMNDPKAIIGFGGNVSPALLKNLDFGNDMLAKDISSIRQVYGSIGSSDASFSASLVARTFNPAQSQSLSDTVTGLKQLGGLFMARLPEAKRKLAQSALDNLKIAAQGTELRIRTDVSQADVASVIKTQ
jgi:hypothetical protein